ncbi:MAG: hypothetical protein IJJ41_00975 [Clostridia bacterium]|nr:hypothetical protein [Clostridia bacterium]
MKKTVCLLCILLTVLSLAACAKQKESAVPEKLKEEIPNAYVGDVDVQQTVKTKDLEIIRKDSIFYVNDIEFTFREFEDTEKLSTNMGEDMLDVYVKDGELQKYVVTAIDGTAVTTYHADGTTASVLKAEVDEYGNQTYVAHYDGAGKLKDFYTAAFEKMNLTEKREYNAAMDLVSVTKYEYDKKSGKLIKEITYDAALELKDVKEY